MSALTHKDCLDGPRGCRGAVEYRQPLSASGVPFPRCELHWGQRLDRQQEISRNYPDSPSPPSWFDPTYAGETWDEESS